MQSVSRLMQSVLQDEGKGIVLDQFGNLANPLAHYKGTGPEVWEQTKGRVTHFVSSMGTTGTIMGTSKYLKEQNPDVRIVGLQPKEGSAIAGIRRWPKEYLPTIFQVTVRPHVASLHISLVACQPLKSRLPVCSLYQYCCEQFYHHVGLSCRLVSSVLCSSYT